VSYSYGNSGHRYDHDGEHMWWLCGCPDPDLTPDPVAEPWTAAQHQKDAKIVQTVLQRVAERSTGQPVYVPLDDASQVLMGLHLAGLYKPETTVDKDSASEI
jgi:hypothetical protein